MFCPMGLSRLSVRMAHSRFTSMRLRARATESASWVSIVNP